MALVDAFGIEDYVLNSALGRQDGDVYTALLDMAQVCAGRGWGTFSPNRSMINIGAGMFMYSNKFR